PWPVARFVLRAGLAAHRLGRWAGRSVARLLALPFSLSLSLPDVSGAIRPPPLARLWRPVHHGKIVRPLLRNPLLRGALRRGWQCGIARPLARDLLKLLVLRRLATGDIPDPVPFRIRWAGSSQSVRFESVPSNSRDAVLDQSEYDWPAL